MDSNILNIEENKMDENNSLNNSKTDSIDSASELNMINSEENLIEEIENNKDNINLNDDKDSNKKDEQISNNIIKNEKKR